MRFDVAGALWAGVASWPWRYPVGGAILLLGVLAARGVLRSRRVKGSIRPIGYFSYITHSSVPSVCAQCGVEVPEKTKRYCLANAPRFKGMVYCDRHQRRF